MMELNMTDDFSPPEAKRQLWQKLRQIDVDAIARKEKALAQLAAQLDEVAAAISRAEAKAEAAEAKAKASAADAATAKREVQERDRLARRQVEDMHELTRKRDALAAFCKSKGIEA
jgi:chromosome segregation ATPase